MGDSKLKEANMSSNSDTVDEVRAAVAASALARHRETMLNLDKTTSESVSKSSWSQVTAENRSS